MAAGRKRSLRITAGLLFALWAIGLVLGIVLLRAERRRSCPASRRLYSLLGVRYNFCYTHRMKTAISIPDALFREAELYAQTNGLSRSELYARAVQVYLDFHRHQGVTAALDEVYAEDANPLDPTVARAQAHAVEKESW